MFGAQFRGRKKWREPGAPDARRVRAGGYRTRKTTESSFPSDFTRRVIALRREWRARFLRNEGVHPRRFPVGTHMFNRSANAQHGGMDVVP